MDFRVLGRVEVRRNGRNLDLGAPRQRTVLAALLLNANRPVPADRLAAAVWFEPPSGAAGNLRAYLAGLRKILHPPGDPQVRLHTIRGGGYLLRVRPGELDLDRFEGLARHGEEALRGNRPAQAAAAFEQAVRLWRGPALEGLNGGSELATEITRLEERRLAVTERWIQVLLDNPVPLEHLPLPDIVSELRRLVATNPLRERQWAQLMLALCRVGRPGEALAAYAQVRAVLADELGTDPGPELRDLHLRILRADPAVITGTSRTTTPAPAQLPPDMTGFAGRDTELACLELVEAGTIVVTGMAGVGKTALAVRWAHRMAALFPDGQLYANLRGYDPDPPLAPQIALDWFLRAAGVGSGAIPRTLEERSALFRSALATRRMLVVLDNARSAEQVRPLLPGTPNCLTIVTSRDDLAGLVVRDGAHRITLDRLPEPDALDMLRSVLGRERVDTEPEAAADLVKLCGSLPLALRIVAERAAARPAIPLADLLVDLHDHTGPLDTLDLPHDPTTAIRDVFSWSYQSLSSGAARLFRLLGLHPGPEIGTPAVASLAGVPPERLRPMVAELTRAHLLTEQRTGRYHLHDLLRAYAGELAQAVSPDSERHAALHRLLDHYLHTAHAAALLLNPKRKPIALPPPPPGFRPEPLPAGGALAWFTVEHPVLTAVVSRAVEAQFDQLAAQLAWALSDFLQWRWHSYDWAATQSVALDVARRGDDLAGQCEAHHYLGCAYAQLDRDGEAMTQFHLALDGFAELGDLTGKARTHFQLGWVFERAGSYPTALTQAEQALAAYGAAGDRLGRARALNAVGWCRVLLGEYETARQHCEQALVLQGELDDRRGQANTWDSLGFISHKQGDHRQAITCYEHATALLVEHGDRVFEATVLTHLGDAQRAAGDPEAAHDTWRRALAILDGLQHPEAGQVRRRLGAVG
jgi:DNA-binding SARP family transcriptional activator/tetratricopeptide (TPR) repeat protein